MTDALRRSSALTTDASDARTVPAGALTLSQIILFVLLAVLMLLGLSKPMLLLSGLVARDDADTLRRVTYGAITLIALVVVQPFGRWRRVLTVPWPFVLVIMWFGFTILWSAVPGASFSRLALTAIVTWLAFQCPDRLGATRSMQMARVVLGLWLLVNYVAIVATPTIGIHDYGQTWSHGQWRGLMGHKNLLGTAAAFALLFAIFPAGDRRTLLPRLALGVGALPLLVFSQSRAAMLGAAVAVIVGFGVTRFGSALDGGAGRQVRAVLLALFGVIAVALLVLTVDPDLLLGALGNPKALSGRTQIWQTLLASFREHPLLGTGYGAFWASGAVAPTQKGLGMNWLAISTGHNGYLDLVVQTGMVGVFLAFGALLAWTGLRIVKLAPAHPAIAGLAAALVVFALTNNFAESSLFDGDQMPQLFALLGLGMLQAAARRNRRGRAGAVVLVSTPVKAVRRRRRSRKSTASQ